MGKEKQRREHDKIFGGGNRFHKQLQKQSEENKKDEHSRLRIEDLCINPDVEDLEKIFGKFPGFVRVNYDSSRPGLCFVEYDNQNQSLTAMDKLNGLNSRDHRCALCL